MPNTTQRAILALLITVAFADGDFDVEEFKVIIHRLPDHPLFQGLSEDEIHAANLSLLDELHTSSKAAMIGRYASAVPPHLALQTFSLVLDMMYADGVVDDFEGHVVLATKNALGISKADFDAVLDRAKAGRTTDHHTADGDPVWAAHITADATGRRKCQSTRSF